MGLKRGILTKGDRFYCDTDFGRGEKIIAKAEAILELNGSEQVEVDDLSWNDVNSRKIIIVYSSKKGDKWCYGTEAKEI